VAERGFHEEELFDFGGGTIPVDNTRDGQHVFWFHFDEQGENVSVVWDGVPGPRFDDLGFFNEMPVVFSPDKCHVAWFGKRGEKFVVVVDGEVVCEWSKAVSDVAPVLSRSGRVAFLMSVEGRLNVVLDGKVISDWEVPAASPVFSPDGDRLAFVAFAGAGKFCVVVDGVAGPAVDEVGSAVVEGEPQSLFFSRDGQRVAYGAKTRR
jgi:WD40-like Beta Propeller Repeat